MIPFEKSRGRKTAPEQNTQQQETESFYFGPQNIRHIGKRTGRILRTSNQNSTFIKLQGSPQSEDYLIVARQQQTSFSQIPRQIEPNYTDMESSRQPNMSTIVKNEEQAKIDDDIDSDDQKQKESKTKIQIKQDNNRNLQKENRKSVDKRYGIVENSPFFVQNVSSVKYRYSAGGRKSEEFLLELLKTEKSRKKADQNQQNSQNENIKRNQNLEKQQQFRKMKQDQKAHLNLQIQKKPQSKRRQSQLIRDKKQTEQKPKSKRVTINDRGKIKLPTDSFSLQFNSVNPLQLKNDLNEIQQKQEEHHYVEEIQLKEDQKKQLQKELLKQKKPKKSKPKNSIINKPSKSKSLKSKQSQEQQTNEERKMTKRRKVDDYLDQKNQNVIQEVVQPPINPTTGRPKRQKKPRQEFYKSLKTIYNNKNEVIMRGITSEQFLQILGYSIFKQIKQSSIDFGSNYIKGTYRLKAKQQISSIGVDQEKLYQYIKHMANFDKLWIQSVKSSKFIKIKVDNFSEQTLEGKIYIDRDQKVQIRNISQNKPQNIVIGIERSLRSQEQQQ